MKKNWLIVLSILLMVALSSSAFAVDVKFSGEYYAAGLYLDKVSFKKDGTQGPSTAFYFQRLRLTTDFVVSPGLTLITRVNIMERAWGAARSAPGAALDTASSATRAENENIGFDFAYLQYASPIGIFTAGIQPDGGWATPFGNTVTPIGKVTYLFIKPAGPGNLIMGIDTGKIKENSYTAINPDANSGDKDNSFVSAMAIYGWKNGDAGIYVRYNRDATLRSVPLFKGEYFWIAPYLRTTIGPVALQTEVNWLVGKIKFEEGIPANNIDVSQFDFWADATVNLGQFYFGGTLAYVAGDDPGTTDKMEGGILTGGRDWQPCVIMFNSDRNYWAGDITGYDASTMSGPMTNAWFFQGRAGVRPIDKLDIMASISYANADKKPTDTWLYNDYGWEADLVATYKITNNLSYMLGGGYLFTGKFFKGASENNRDLSNNYMVINKLTLTF